MRLRLRRPAQSANNIIALEKSRAPARRVLRRAFASCPERNECQFVFYYCIEVNNLFVWLKFKLNTTDPGTPISDTFIELLSSYNLLDIHQYIILLINI